LSIEIEWTTTTKELEKTGFKVGLDKVFRDFWKMYVIIIPLLVGMLYMGLYSPDGWRITDFTVITPLANQLLCHALLPVCPPPPPPPPSQYCEQLLIL